MNIIYLLAIFCSNCCSQSTLNRFKGCEVLEKNIYNYSLISCKFNEDEGLLSISESKLDKYKKLGYKVKVCYKTYPKLPKIPNE